MGQLNEILVPYSFLNVDLQYALDEKGYLLLLVFDFLMSRIYFWRSMAWSSIIFIFLKRS